MNKLRKAMMALGVLLVTSGALVSCSDDGPSEMGASAVNSCLATSNSVTIYWTVTPNEKCAGYEVTIYQGTRENLGAEVTKYVTDDNKDCSHTFTGLAPNTAYVIMTQGIPAPNSGFKSAEPYYQPFMTAPLVNVTSVSCEVKTVQSTDVITGDVTITDYAFATVHWEEYPISNCGDYSIALTTVEKNKDGKDVVVNVASATVAHDKAAAGRVFGNLKLDTEYTITCRPVANNACWYRGNGDATTYKFKTPASK